MKALLVLDSHVHFWDPRVLSYPWLAELPTLARTFLPVDMDALSTGATTGALFIEANCAPLSNEQEVAFVEGLIEHDPRIAGIVAHVDLLDAERRELQLARFRRHARVVGIRHNIQGQAPGFCTQRAFVRGVARTGELGFPFDLCATAEQLHDVRDLVSQCPGTTFILDHCGKPAIRRDVFAPWSEAVSALAELPNVHCKLSGLFTEATLDQRYYQVLAPYADHVRSCFGEDRLMYGSDWPVVTLAAGEAEWRAFCNRFTQSWTPLARHGFYVGNACRVYGIPLLQDTHATR